MKYILIFAIGYIMAAFERVITRKIEERNLPRHLLHTETIEYGGEKTIIINGNLARIEKEEITHCITMDPDKNGYCIKSEKLSKTYYLTNPYWEETYHDREVDARVRVCDEGKTGEGYFTTTREVLVVSFLLF
ncbi:MAG: hypothetical protein IJ794_02950 [Lachnospiraceae bacterium]|nr:hypothetical protein [Lachnospiraceae bacterium]